MCPDQIALSAQIERAILISTNTVSHRLRKSKYSRTSIARTSLGPKKIVRDMGGSSHWGFIMVPGQEADSDNLGICFSIFYTITVCWVYSLESTR